MRCYAGPSSVSRIKLLQKNKKNKKEGTSQNKEDDKTTEITGSRIQKARTIEPFRRESRPGNN